MTRPAPTRPPGAGQARGDRTRALIVDETVRCVLDEGFAAASAKHIAERAGVTWGVVQYHFGDRDGILTAVVRAGFDTLVEEMSRVQVAPGPVRAQVTAVVDAAWAAFSSPLSRAAFEILVATRTDRDPALDAQQGDLARQTRRLATAVAPDHPVVGDLVWSALRGMALTQMVVREEIDSSRDRAALVEVVTSYLAGHESDPPGGA